MGNKSPACLSLGCSIWVYYSGAVFGWGQEEAYADRMGDRGGGQEAAILEVTYFWFNE